MVCDGLQDFVNNDFRRLSAKSKEPCDTVHYATSANVELKNAANINEIPLTEPITGLSKTYHVKQSDIKPFDSKLTVLENGLKVASEPHYGMYCTVGVAMDAGARYEVEYPSGTSHFVEKLAFSATPSYPTKEDTFSLLERCGALIDCQSTKDTFIYASSCRKDRFSDILTLIADSTQRPVIKPSDLEDARLIIGFENKDMNSKPECEPLLTDWIHAAAYNDNTLGFTKYCPDENITKITREHIYSYMKQYFSLDRMVVAGVGVDHDSLVAACKDLFDETRTAWSEDSSLLLERMPAVDNSFAQYTGGDKRVTKDLSKMALGPTPYPNLAHFVLGFESCGYKDDDFVAFCVLQSLMGGGGSFSAGGPGKGMYTRLYVDVLNRYHWMYNATAYNNSYADSGLFHIQASSDPLQLGQTVAVILENTLRLLEGTKEEELARAKTQLKSHLMMNLEIRPVMFEDMARQVLGHGRRVKPNEYVDKINSIANKDIVRVAERMLSTRPAVVGYGDLLKLPSYELIDDAVAKRDIGILKPSRFFRY